MSIIFRTNFLLFPANMRWVINKSLLWFSRVPDLRQSPVWNKEFPKLGPKMSKSVTFLGQKSRNRSTFQFQNFSIVKRLWSSNKRQLKIFLKINRIHSQGPINFNSISASGLTWPPLRPQKPGSLFFITFCFHKPLHLHH